jgi:hypothetical protein
MATMSAFVIAAPCASKTTPRNAPVDASCPKRLIAHKEKMTTEKRLRIATRNGW